MSLWSRFLGRMGRDFKPLFPVRDTWCRGDLGECIAGGVWQDARSGAKSAGPKLGELIRVAGVHDHNGHVYLAVERFPREFYEAGAFRKIVKQREEACSETFAKKISRLRRKVDA